MHSRKRSSFFHGFARGLLASMSIAAGYLPIAVSFGLAAMQAGLSPWVSILTSVVVYAGASQFILIALLASGAGWLVAVPTVLLMNARHLFYGPALLARLGQMQTQLPAPVLAFGLTDEVFATALAQLGRVPARLRPAWYVGLQTGAYAAWITGTVVGVSLSASLHDIPVFIAATLEFILPALFFALLLEIGRASAIVVIATTALACISLLPLLPGYHAMALGMLVGALAGAVRSAEHPHD